MIKTILRKSTIFMWIFHKYQLRVRKIFSKNEHLFKGKRGVEIGGPSIGFRKNGPLPIYNIIESLDNINYSDKTFWSSISEGQDYQYQEGKKTGRQIIADGIDLSKIKDNSYDFMLSSHVIEHIANPIKAIEEWKRVIKENGHLFIIVPFRDKTYDRKRPLTTIEHLIEDYINQTEESDTTHIEEVIHLHDLTVDSTVNSYEEHVERTLNNIKTRIVHHHTFDMNLVIQMLEYCKFKIIDSQFVYSFNLVVIAQKV